MRPALNDVSSNVSGAPADNDGNKGSGRENTSCSSTSRRDDGAVSLEESGAALCVRLGALPAVLDCLNEHDGHKQIEPLAVRLLSIFACDRATAGAVRGNTTVAAACTSRMFPVAISPAAEDASGIGLGSDASRRSRVSPKNTVGGDKTRASAGPGRTREHTDDGQRRDCSVPTEKAYRKYAGQYDQLVGTKVGGDIAAANDNQTSDTFTASSASTMDSHLNSGGTPKQRSSISAATTTSKPTTNPTPTEPFRTALGSATSSSRPAASAEGISHIPRGQIPHNQTSPTALTKSPLVRLPPMDLVFVLSVAVKNSPECQRLVIQSGGIAAMLATLRHQTSGLDREASACCSVSESVCSEGDGGARLAEMCLKVMEGLGQTERGRRRLVREGCLETAIAVLARFRWASQELLLSTGSTHPVCMSSPNHSKIFVKDAVAPILCCN